MPRRRLFLASRSAFAALLVAATLAGCNRGVQATLSTMPKASTDVASVPGALAPATPAPKVVLPIEKPADVAVPDQIIVRFKGARRDLPGATYQTELNLPNTYLYNVKQGAYAVQALEDQEDAEDVDYIEPNYYCVATAVPNDPQFNSSWGVGAIQAPNAWNTATGSGITVAVLDTGVNARHADLAGQVLQGVDLINRDDDASDDFGHGTHVAGTIAALANNGVGVAGVAPQAKILPIKVLNAKGQGATTTIADGILEAAKRGAKVINLSLGSPDTSETLRRAIAQAQSQGAIVVAAAGNDNVNTPFYPAGYDGVIAVGAVDPAHRKASFSNYGSTLDLVAPGTDILSTGYQGNYVSMSGTSMAAPHVAGAVALMLSRFPQLKVEQIARLFQQTGTQTSGFGMSDGPKELNVAAALAQAPAYDVSAPSQVQNLTARPGAPGEVVLNWSPATDNRGVSGYKVLRDGEVIATVTGTTYTDLGLRQGQKSLYTIVAFDADGNQSLPSLSAVSLGGTPSALYQDLRVAKRTNNSVTITWRTTTPVQAYLQWGEKAGLGAATAREAQPTTEHSITLNNLARFKKYYFRAVAQDAGGEMQYSETKSARTKLWLLFGM